MSDIQVIAIAALIGVVAVGTLYVIVRGIDNDLD